MAASSFNIKYPGKSADFVFDADKTIKKNGGVFSGDQKNGNFSLKTLIGAVKGNYKILSEIGEQVMVEVTITQKPMLVPMTKIQEVIKGYFWSKKCIFEMYKFEFRVLNYWNKIEANFAIPMVFY